MTKYNIKVKDFMALSQADQDIWIEENIEDFEIKLYGDAYIGVFYPDDIDWDEYLNNPVDYGVSGLIASCYPVISDERMEEIDEGAELTDKEKKHLFSAIAESDVDNWITHNTFEVEMLDGNVFVYFHGHSMGQGGFDFKYQKAFESYHELLTEISEFPLSSIE